MTKIAIDRTLCACGVAIAVLLATATSARAQGFVSPLVGYDFGGDSGCPSIDNCADKKLNAGVGFGSFGRVLGAELELAYANNFFGEAPSFSSSVLTLMANALAGPQIGPVRPYGTGGFGLIKTRVDLTPGSLLSGSNNHVGWNIGGGLMILMGKHLGIRGELRRFHAFQHLAVPLLPIDGATLDFNRASAALMLRF